MRLGRSRCGSQLGWITAVCCLVATSSGAQEPVKPSALSVSVGFALPMTDVTIWMGDKADVWAERSLGLSLDLSYRRSLNPFIFFGGYGFWEDMSLSYMGYEGGGARYGVGILAGARYPDRPLHFVLGGHFGMALVDLEKADLGTGIEWGMFFGPELEIGDYSVGIEFAPVFSWVISGDDLTGMNIPDPRIRARFSYRF